MPAQSTGNCWRCGKELSGEDYARSQSCPRCDADTRACRNCVNFEAASRSECRESAAEPVRDSEKANYCEYFAPASTRPARQAGLGKNGDAKEAFNKLFGGKGSPGS